MYGESRKKDDESDDVWAKRRNHYPWSTAVLVPRNDEVTEVTEVTEVSRRLLGTTESHLNATEKYAMERQRLIVPMDLKWAKPLSRATLLPW